MYVVKRFDPIGWAKAYTIATLLVLAVIMLPTLGIVTLAVVFGGSGNDQPAIPIVLLAFAALSLVVGFMTFLVAFIQGVVFNWALARIGGLPIELDVYRQT